MCWVTFKKPYSFFFFKLTSAILCCYLVAKLCLTLCNYMDCSLPGFPVLCYLLEFAQESQWCYLTISSSAAFFSLCLQSFLASRSFPVSRLFTASGQSIGASERVLPMNIQGWFPLGLTGLIPLGLSRIFSSTTVWKYQLSGAQPSLWTNSHILERP